MLGQPVSMLIPEVVGFKLTGSLGEGITATDLVLTCTQMLRAHGVVGERERRVVADFALHHDARERLGRRREPVEARQQQRLQLAAVALDVLQDFGRQVLEHVALEPPQHKRQHLRRPPSRQTQMAPHSQACLTMQLRQRTRRLLEQRRSIRLQIET